MHIKALKEYVNGYENAKSIYPFIDLTPADRLKVESYLNSYAPTHWDYAINAYAKDQNISIEDATALFKPAMYSEKFAQIVSVFYGMKGLSTIGKGNAINDLKNTIQKAETAVDVNQINKNIKNSNQNINKQQTNKTDGTRPTPQQSETDVGTNLGSEYKGQVSYQNGVEVPYGTKGSVRPDFCNGTTCSIEVKNYNIEKYSNNLINNVSKQAIDRQVHLPEGMQQQIVIDARGQNLTPVQEFNIRQGIKNKSNGIIQSGQIRFLTDKR